MFHGTPRRQTEAAEYERRRREKLERETREYCDLWRTVPNAAPVSTSDLNEKDARERHPPPPAERNLLYFLEKNSLALRDWQRELLRIVRNLAQYFYPQRQTKLMNEGYCDLRPVHDCQ